jgi:hypothetical protein
MSAELTTVFEELSPEEQAIIMSARSSVPTAAPATITIADYDGGPETKLFNGTEAEARGEFNVHMSEPKNLGKTLFLYLKGRRYPPLPVTKRSLARARQWIALMDW